MTIPADPRLGTRLAGYRIQALLGRGGMGVVYRAEQLGPHRTVALKLLSAQVATSEAFRERFLRESELAATIDHPNVLPVYDAGETDGVLWIAMRYVDGTDLQALLDRDGPLALAFLEAYPTPQAAARLGEARLAAFCRRHSYRGGRSPAELLARLRSAPTPPLGLVPETLAGLVRAQVRLLRTLLGTIADLDRALGAGLLGHAKAGLLAPMPRIGEVNLAQLVAEVGPILDRVDNAEQAIAECGAAPVTRASGKTRTVGFRWAANRRARTALHAFADNSRHASPWAAKLYADARRRGKHHPHAIRILARAWLRVMWACWHTDTAYDPANHGSEQRLAA